LWQEQARNRRTTVLLILGFVLLLALLGLGIDFFLHARGANGAALPGPFVPVAAPVALAVGVLQTVGGYYGGARAVLASSRARPANPADPREQTLLNVVEEMRLASGLPRPQVYVLPDPDPNAFAVGRDPQHAAVAVTQGLLETLDREELQGVVAHEMGHVRNFDIRTMTLVAALLGALVLLSDFAARMLRFGGAGVGRSGGGGRRGDRDGGGGALVAVLFVVWLVLIFVTPLLGQMMAFAVSRRREYDADAAAAEFTRNPRGLAGALRKLDAAAHPTTTIGRGSAHLCIVDPRGRWVNEREGPVASLFATHPPIEKRIALLEAMAGGRA
jgi:heat shock protein HtpX